MIEFQIKVDSRILKAILPEMEKMFAMLPNLEAMPMLVQIHWTKILWRRGKAG